MTLTPENYFSPEAQAEYMSSSQFKAFDRCEAAALAEVRGDYTPVRSSAVMLGSYIDAHFSGDMERFRQENPDIFRRDGMLKSEYVHADETRCWSNICPDKSR